MDPCAMAKDLLEQEEGPCKALEIEDGRAWCGLVRRPAWYMFGEVVPSTETGSVSVLMATALGFGVGCDAK